MFENVRHKPYFVQKTNFRPPCLAPVGGRSVLSASSGQDTASSPSGPRGAGLGPAQWNHRLLRLHSAPRPPASPGWAAPPCPGTRHLFGKFPCQKPPLWEQEAVWVMGRVGCESSWGTGRPRRRPGPAEFRCVWEPCVAGVPGSLAEVVATHRTAPPACRTRSVKVTFDCLALI